MTDKNYVRRRKEFFFAEAAAGMYDLTIGMVVPHYDLMHELVIYLLEQHGLRSGDVVLDVGSGTGADSIAILNAFPNVQVISIDLCAPIQEEHHRKLRELDTAVLRLRERSTLICCDVMNYASGSRLVAEVSPRAPFAAVVTSLTIHHLGHAEKQRFYRLMYEALSPSGCLINADLYTYSNPKMALDALKYDLAWMTREFESPLDSSARAIPAVRRRQLFKKWIEHYRKSNRLESIEDGPKAPGQLSMIRKAGFTDAVVPYRLSLSGIVFAVK